MTKQEIIEMVHTSGIPLYGMGANKTEFMHYLKAFAKLVAAHEREACAKMCDYVYDNIVTDEHIKDMAFKIRARGQE